MNVRDKPPSQPQSSVYSQPQSSVYSQPQSSVYSQPQSSVYSQPQGSQSIPVKLPRCSRGWRRNKKTKECKKKRCKNGTRKFNGECRKYPFPKKKDKYLYEKFLNNESLTPPFKKGLFERQVEAAKKTLEFLNRRKLT